ncbi:MAG TPA: 4Fe-4S dicluster domain-containing protein [Deltaproteobacteria bacterium]|nr:4Fe-4S dicluster domain-containing protein [Deltaproteobacteria bacterium]
MHVTIEALLVYVPILGLIWFFYAHRAKGRSQHDAAVLAQSIEDGLMQPASLHPVIDPSLCLGCGTCVDACPEKSVLGIVVGKAELITPANCIGHGACKDACPFDAIRLVLGTEERGVDIPWVSENFETNVPGIFVAGELGGMGLIRNGIEQGKQAMDAIAATNGERAKGAAGDDVLDVVIIGAGPAGLSASLAAKKHGLRFETLEQESLGGTVAHYPRGKIVMTAPVDLPLYGKVKIRETTKEALLELWEKVIDETQVRIEYGCRVERVERMSNGLFSVQATTRRLRTRAVLLAIGRRGTPRKLGVSGEDQTKVVYRLIDPEQYAGKHVVVVGGGDSALEAAWSLADVAGTDVTLSYRNAAFGRAKAKNRESVKRAVEAGRLRLLLNSKITGIGEDTIDIETPDGALRLDNDAVIICAGGILPTDFLRSMEIEVVTEHGRV